MKSKLISLAFANLALLGLAACDSPRALVVTETALTMLEQRGVVTAADAQALRLGGRLLLSGHTPDDGRQSISLERPAAAGDQPPYPPEVKRQPPALSTEH